MRKSIFTVAAVGAAATLALAACSSSGGGGNTSSTPPVSNSSSTSTSPSATGGAQVGVILPDTTSSTRYTLYDAPLLTKAFADAGVKADIQNAGGDTAKFTSLAQSMIGEGVKVLLIDSIDPTSGAAVEASAKTAGVKVIDYDRVNLGGSADYYVSLSNEKVGQLQGQTLVACLAAKSVTDPKIIEMDGGTDVDNNAVLFKKGALAILDPLQSAGKLKIVSDSVVKGWKTELAAPTFTQALTAAGGKVDGVLAANDDIANAVIGVLKSNGLAGKVQVTGQDSGIEGLQNILQGNQCMTVFKNVSLEAAAASKLAIALATGADPSTAGSLVDFNDPTGNRTLKALLLAPEVITIKNVQDVITAGALKASDICNGIQAACDKAGIK